jgi:hypothetical protein
MVILKIEDSNLMLASQIFSACAFALVFLSDLLLRRFSN